MALISPQSFLDPARLVCKICNKKYSRRSVLQVHKRTIHGSGKVHTCAKCPFRTCRIDHLRRHHALLHLRRRSAYVPRRSISTTKKRKAVAYWNSSTATTPEKRSYVEKHFKLTPNSQTRLFRKKHSVSNAKKRLFREEGGGRKTDEFWVRIEEKLLTKFTARRAMGARVHKRHVVNFVYEACAELEISLAAEGEKRGWKAPAKLIRQRVDRFCRKFKIKMKRASRQYHKDPEVSE